MTDRAPLAEGRSRREQIFSLFLEQTLQRGTPYWWRPRGLSMSPTILDGERVLIAPVDPRDLGIGDVVKFRLGDRLTLHRLIGRHHRSDGALQFAFRGDNATQTEILTGSSGIIGRAIAVERRGVLVTLCSRGARFRGLARVGRSFLARS